MPNKRGLGSSKISEERKQEIRAMGGRASHGGGRKKRTAPLVRRTVMRDIFRFIGDENITNPETGKRMKYKNNYKYIIKVVTMPNMTVQIEAPIKWTYSSLEEFFESWERVS